MNFKAGELIKWYELYGDIHIVRNSGLGIIIETTENYSTYYEQIVYKVYRILQKDTMMVEEYCIEKIKGDKKND